MKIVVLLLMSKPFAFLPISWRRRHRCEWFIFHNLTREFIDDVISVISLYNIIGDELLLNFGAKFQR